MQIARCDLWNCFGSEVQWKVFKLSSRVDSRRWSSRPSVRSRSVFGSLAGFAWAGRRFLGNPSPPVPRTTGYSRKLLRGPWRDTRDSHAHLSSAHLCAPHPNGCPPKVRSSSPRSSFLSTVAAFPRTMERANCASAQRMREEINSQRCLLIIT